MGNRYQYSNVYFRVFVAAGWWIRLNHITKRSLYCNSLFAGNQYLKVKRSISNMDIVAISSTLNACSNYFSILFYCYFGFFPLSNICCLGFTKYVYVHHIIMQWSLTPICAMISYGQTSRITGWIWAGKSWISVQLASKCWLFFAVILHNL